jgi:Leucine-rich repeat (LRR) protein
MNDEVSMKDYILDIFYSTKGDLSKINEIIDAKLMVNRLRKITVFETFIKSRLILNPKHFKMANMDISPVEAIYLSQYPDMATVEILDIRKNGFGDDGLAGIVHSPILKNVRELDLRNNNITRVGAQMLANSETLQNLEKLDLRLNKLGKRWEEKMLESDHLTKLKEIKVA